MTPPIIWYHEETDRAFPDGPYKWLLPKEAVPYMLARPMPIETAPRDGTWVLGYCGTIGAPAWLSVLFDDGMWLDEFDHDCTPSHWLPLPPAPEES